MNKRLISTILIMALILALVPATSMAEPSSGVNVFGQITYYNKIITKTNAYNISGIESGSIEIGAKPLGSAPLIVTLTDLVISTTTDSTNPVFEISTSAKLVLVGKNEISVVCSDTGNSAYICIMPSSNSLELSGSGTLDIHVSTNGGLTGSVIGLFVAPTSALTLNCGGVNITASSNTGNPYGIFSPGSVAISSGNNSITAPVGINMASPLSSLSFTGGTTKINASTAAIRTAATTNQVTFSDLVVEPADVAVEKKVDADVYGLCRKGTGEFVTTLSVHPPYPISAATGSAPITYTHEDWVRDNQYDEMPPASGLEPDKAAPAEELFGTAATNVVPETTTSSDAAPATVPPQTADTTTLLGFLMLLVGICALMLIRKRV